MRSIALRRRRRRTFAERFHRSARAKRSRSPRAPRRLIAGQRAPRHKRSSSRRRGAIRSPPRTTADAWRRPHPRWSRCYPVAHRTDDFSERPDPLLQRRQCHAHCQQRGELPLVDRRHVAIHSRYRHRQLHRDHDQRRRLRGYVGTDGRGARRSPDGQPDVQSTPGPSNRSPCPSA